MLYDSRLLDVTLITCVTGSLVITQLVTGTHSPLFSRKDWIKTSAIAAFWIECLANIFLDSSNYLWMAAFVIAAGLQCIVCTLSAVTLLRRQPLTLRYRLICWLSFPTLITQVLTCILFARMYL